MQATNLIAGQKVKISGWGLNHNFTIASTKASNRIGYIDFILKEASNVFRIPYSKQLDYCDDIPILC